MGSRMLLPQGDVGLYPMHELGRPVQKHFYNRKSQWTQLEQRHSFNGLIASYFPAACEDWT